VARALPGDSSSSSSTSRGADDNSLCQLFRFRFRRGVQLKITITNSTPGHTHCIHYQLHIYTPWHHFIRTNCQVLPAFWRALSTQHSMLLLVTHGVTGGPEGTKHSCTCAHIHTYTHLPESQGITTGSKGPPHNPKRPSGWQQLSRALCSCASRLPCSQAHARCTSSSCTEGSVCSHLTPHCYSHTTSC